MSMYNFNVIVASEKKRTVNALLGEAQNLDVIGVFLQYEAQGLLHSGIWDAVFPTKTMC